MHYCQEFVPVSAAQMRSRAWTSRHRQSGRTTGEQLKMDPGSPLRLATPWMPIGNLAVVLTALPLLALPATAHAQVAATDVASPVGEFTAVYIVAITALVVALNALI